jgi:hypothetical protein
MPDSRFTAPTATASRPLERPARSPHEQALIKHQYDVVLGCPRSGTTFLMEALDAIPSIECVTGAILPVSIPHLANADLSPELYDALAVGVERALDDYMESGRARSRAAGLQKWVNAPTGLSGLTAALTGRPGLSRLVYKEPFLSFAPELVYYALPDAKMIHLVRDGRDCANSLRRTYDVLTDEHLTHLMGAEMRLGRKVDHRYVPWWVEEGRESEFLDASPYSRSVWMWAYMVRRCHDFFAQPEVQDSGRVMPLRYEDFMEAPLQWGQAVLDHLGLDFTAGFRRRVQNAHTASIGKHESRPQQDVAEATRLAHDELQLYGYL